MSLAGRMAGTLVRDPARAWLMARMAASYGVVVAAARFLPLNRAFGLLETSLRPRRPGENATLVVNALDTLLHAGIPFIHPQCWRRAVILQRYLRRVGIDTTIVFGILTEATALTEAHAWLEREGAPFAEPGPVAQYRRIHTFLH